MAVRPFDPEHIPPALLTDDKARINTNIQFSQERVVEKLSQWYPAALRENPELTYLMKFHDDTVLMHHNFWRFLRSLHSRVDDETPIYFGTAHGDEVCCCGMWDYPPTSRQACYAQGGGGYGINRAALRIMAPKMRQCQSFGARGLDALDAGQAGGSQLWGDALFGKCYKYFTGEPVIHCGSFHGDTPRADEARKAHGNETYAPAARIRNARASAVSFHKMYPDKMDKFYRTSSDVTRGLGGGGTPGGGDDDDEHGGGGINNEGRETLYRLYDRKLSYEGWDAAPKNMNGSLLPQNVDLWSV